MNPWTLLVNGLGSLLSVFYSIIPNYGVAIILLTLVISLLLFPLTLKQTRSMKGMQEIQPEVKRLQKELKGDREELNKQLMALYQEHGVNPAAGCLPLLLQMPIWFALFSVLRVEVGANGQLTSGAIPADSRLATDLVAGKTSFLGMDMLISPSSAASSGIVDAIPYIVLILVVVAAGFYQQLQTTRTRKTNGDAPTQQQQSMQNAMKILPLFFGFISWGFPSGLVLYFATSNVFRIGQQSLILRLDDEKAKAAGEGGKPTGNDKSAPGSAGPASQPRTRPGSGPSPHTSKKRKKRRRK